MTTLTNILSPIINYDSKLSESAKFQLIANIGFFVLAGIYIYFQAQYQVSLKSLPYDLDGWGHLVEKLVAQQELGCNISATSAYSPERGYLLSLLFAGSYCLMGIPESVQIINALFHLLTCVALILFISKISRSILLALAVSAVWTIWPAYSYLYGYYFSEPIGAFLVILLTFLTHKIFTEKETSAKNYVLAIALGILMGVLINVRPSSLFFIAGLFIFSFFILRHQKRLIAICAAGFLIVYASLPILNYQQFNTFIPFTLQGGYALFLGNHIPSQGAPAGNARELAEFRQIEENAKDLNALEKDKYFKQLAIKDAIANPVESAQLLVRKAFKYWMYIPSDSWKPSNKSLIIGLPLLILWLVSLFKNRQLIFYIATLAIVSHWAMHTIVHSEYRYAYVTLPLVLFSVGHMLLKFIRDKINES
ncbi:hypothetical protein [Glaciecola sp. 1036]|uniref:hypothetical protein n=1 Tax=Alteromonadaceae TaxID=72275 RepID=UPI003D0194CD